MRGVMRFDERSRRPIRLAREKIRFDGDGDGDDDDDSDGKNRGEIRRSSIVLEVIQNQAATEALMLYGRRLVTESRELTDLPGVYVVDLETTRFY
ncbi:hypothetical protein Q3G72_003931 [Acer saccharum]|nr:hypothetical protein Q3G72_003931 [Acer saccharum]